MMRFRREYNHLVLYQQKVTKPRNSLPHVDYTLPKVSEQYKSPQEQFPEAFRVFKQSFSDCPNAYYRRRSSFQDCVMHPTWREFPDAYISQT